MHERIILPAPDSLEPIDESVLTDIHEVYNGKLIRFTSDAGKFISLPDGEVLSDVFNPLGQLGREVLGNKLEGEIDCREARKYMGQRSRVWRTERIIGDGLMISDSGYLATRFAHGSVDPDSDLARVHEEATTLNGGYFRGGALNTEVQKALNAGGIQESRAKAHTPDMFSRYVINASAVNTSAYNIPRCYVIMSQEVEQLY